jgi:hypothetical protein
MRRKEIYKYYTLMIIKNIILLILLAFIPVTVFSQEKSKKELKEERKLEQQKKTEELINSRTFVFSGTMAHPQGGRTVNLTTTPNFVKFSPGLIDSDMPFFGRAYSGAGYGSPGGLTFKGKPEEFSVEKTKKGYFITAVVKADNESYNISLTVSPEGSGSLSINSVNRSSMSYSGAIASAEGTE